MNDFDKAFNRLINIEQGYTNDPDDNGNWTGGRKGVGKLLGTKFGIAANTYPDIDIKNLTLEKAKAIYKRDWWDKVNADKLGFAIAFQLWFFAVNIGMSTAKRKLQAAVNVAEDGNIGPVSIAAINKIGDAKALFRFHAKIERHYTSLEKFKIYGKGWTNRMAEAAEYAAQDL